MGKLSIPTEIYVYERKDPNEKTISISDSKLVKDIKESIKLSGLKDGMTISFHHHLRDGDFILNKVVEEIGKMGIKDITISSSSLINVHDKIIPYIKDGTITGLITSGLRGELAKEMSYNAILEKPVIFQSHGRRASSIESGEIKIDVTFIAASAADKMGNMNGTGGKNAFGAMGYPMVDAHMAGKVVCITDTLVEYPLYPISIDQTLVDFVVKVDEIGDSSKISSGATRMSTNERELQIAEYGAKALIELGFIKDGYSYQAGSGGAALLVSKFLREYMEENNIKGSFLSGGINSISLELLEDGLFESVLDVQTFDGEAAKMLNKLENYEEMSASMYASPTNKGCVAHMLNVTILSATEVDIDCNVNVLTNSKGVFMGAIGGHQDIAEGSDITLVTIPLTRKIFPIVRDKVTNIVTKGEHIDLVATEFGVAVNPNRKDLLEKLKDSDIPLFTMEELRDKAYEITGGPEEIKYTDKIVGIIEDRNGDILDLVYQVKE